MKALRIETLRKIFRAASLVIVAALIAVFGYLYLRFGNLIVGNIELQSPPSLLTKLETQKLEAALQLHQRRVEAPDPDPTSPNPFKP